MAVQKEIDPQILALCKKVTAKRPRTVIDHILKHGSVTTEELQSIYNYDHPPRAARDVRENGVPLETFRIRSERTGRMIGAYRFDDPAKIKRGRIGGRKAFSKQFRDALLARYDSRDAITGEQMDGRYLQIDHRVPYEVVGDESYNENNLDEYMLLDASSQRAKSWSCERCKNWQEIQDPDTCKTCFWAFPEAYSHIAMEASRRVDVIWRGEEAKAFDRLKTTADTQGVSVAELLKRLADLEG